MVTLSNEIDQVLKVSDNGKIAIVGYPVLWSESLCVKQRTGGSPQATQAVTHTPVAPFESSVLTGGATGWVGVDNVARRTTG